MLREILIRHRPSHGLKFMKLVKRGIQKSFSQHLLLTNVTISLGLSAAGDVIQQYYQISRREQQSWDKLRTRNMTCTGVTVGFLCHHWYQVLDQRLPGRTTKTVLKKLFVDQLVFSPVCILVFISTLSFLKGISHYIDNYNTNKEKNYNEIEMITFRYKQFKEDISDKGIRLYIADWVVWPPAQFINFYFLPTRYRVLYDNTISLLYDVYTSHVMYHTGTLESENNSNKLL